MSATGPIEVATDSSVVVPMGEQNLHLFFPGADGYGLASTARSLEDAVALVNADPGLWGARLDGDQLVLGTTVMRAIGWALAGWAGADAAVWIAADVADPASAAQWVSLGASPDDVRAVRDVDGLLFVIAGDLPRVAEWAALWRWCTPGFARVGAGRGVLAGDVARLGRALETLHGEASDPRGHETLRVGEQDLELVWPRRFDKQFTRFVQDLPLGVAWGDVAACMETGMDPQDAVRFVADGGDMGPVRLLVGLGR